MVLKILLCASSTSLQEGKKEQLIILLVWNIIFREFLLFSIHSSCRM